MEFSGWLRAERAVPKEIEQNDIVNGLTFHRRVSHRHSVSRSDSLSALCKEFVTNRIVLDTVGSSLMIS